jgi:hypothetical protein
MRNKLNLKEGEVQRILSLHKNAVIKEHKISSLNEELLMEKTYVVNLKKRLGLNSGGLKSKDKITKIKVKSFNKDMVEADVTFGDGGSIDVSFDCTKPDIMVIGGDGQMSGSEYRTDEKFKYLIKWYCAGKPKKDRDDVKQEKKNTGYAYTYIPGGKYVVSNTTVNIPGQNMYFRCDAYKKDYHFKYGKVFHKNETLTKKFKSVFCSSNKPSYKQEIKQTFVSETNTKFSLGANTVWKWKNTGKEEVIPDPNSGKNTFLAAGTSGTRYSFDFETIMKAIDDTGKCPRSGTSDQAGTSGTSGVQGTSGTQGTSGVGAPVVIQKPTVTKDDFYQWTMD